MGRRRDKRNRKSKKKSIVPFFIFALFGIAFFTIFNDDAPTPVSTSNSTSQNSNSNSSNTIVPAPTSNSVSSIESKPYDTYISNTRSSGDSYALKGAINTWPDINSNSAKPYSDQESLLATNYYIVLDGSGSMRESTCAAGKTKMDASIDALEQFLQGAPKDANYGLSVFHQGRFKELVELGRQSDWGPKIADLRQRLSPDGGTPLALAAFEAQSKLEEQAKKQLGYGDYNLVLITDGEADPDQDPEPVVDRILQETPLNISVIGFCIDEDNVLNQPGYIQYRTATDPKSLKESLESVLAESVDFNVSAFE